MKKPKFSIGDLVKFKSEFESFYKHGIFMILGEWNDPEDGPGYFIFYNGKHDLNYSWSEDLFQKLDD